MIDPRAPDYSLTPASRQRAAFGYAPEAGVTSPQVSILCPFYNGAAAHFDETAISVFRQSFQNWEFLIVNDMTTNPAALALLERYRNIDPRVRVIDHTENKGLSGARNTAFAAARAEYVMLLDDDDLLEPTAVEKMLWHLESYPEFAVANGWSVGFGAQEYLWPQGFERGDAFLKSNYATGRAMLRKSAWAAVGGYDESIRQGMEDWDFWLKLANAGLWGSTIREYLDWYRRRPDHGDRWQSLDNGDRFTAFCKRLRERYPRIYDGQFPHVQRRALRSRKIARDAFIAQNVLEKTKPRLLMILPWMVMGGADKFNLDLVGQLTKRGWEITIASTLPATHTWMPRFARFTPDIFPMDTFLHPDDWHAYLRYLIDSRRPDVVLVTNSEFGYHLLPYLRSVCPQPAYVDYSHIEEEHWKNGGYPRMGVACQKLLDLNIVASRHLQNWMTQRGADPRRVEVATINVDSKHWSPDADVRRETRKNLGIPERQPVVFYAGRLCPQKRPRVFAEVMRRLAARDAEFTALVAGDGEDRAWLEAFVAEHRLAERVRLRGEQTIDEMHRLMLSADIFFLPSEWEGIALSIYEAMAAGLAVVGADVGGQRELVTPDCGVLVPRTDVETETREYVRALERLLNDETLRRETGTRARQRICEQFALDSMGDRMVELFNRAIELSRTAPRDPVSPEAGLAAAGQALEQVVRELEWAARPVPDGPAASDRPALSHVTSVSATAVSPLAELAAESELWSIENSRAWRALQKVKQNALYRALARLRWGPDWDSRRSAEPAGQRLARVKASHTYRMIQAAKAMPVYRWYAVRKYGPDWERK